MIVGNAHERCVPPILLARALAESGWCPWFSATVLSAKNRQHSTSIEHMPESHAALGDPWSPARLESWARRIGPESHRRQWEISVHEVY